MALVKLSVPAAEARPLQAWPTCSQFSGRRCNNRVFFAASFRSCPCQRLKVVTIILFKQSIGHPSYLKVCLHFYFKPNHQRILSSTGKMWLTAQCCCCVAKHNLNSPKSNLNLLMHSGSSSSTILAGLSRSLKVRQTSLDL